MFKWQNNYLTSQFQIISKENVKMAVFSNLEGTMKKTFILGKNGARFSTDGTEVVVQNYTGTDLIPVSAGEPIKPDNLVTLSYFNAHSGGSAGGALSGTTVPSVSLGNNGDMYFQVDATSIVQIFFKDQGIWKPYATAPVQDSDYVTTFTAQPSDFIQQDQEYVYSISAITHQRGSNLLVQVQDPTGNTVGCDIDVDISGNISIGMTSRPTQIQIVKLIGVTDMTQPYSALVNKIDWITAGDKYSFTVSATTHNQASGPLYLALYENSVDGATSSAPYSLVSLDSVIDGSGNVTFTSYVPLSGKVVISGK